MGRELIGECPASGEDPELANYENELVLKFITQACGEPPRGVDLQISREDHELGSYPVIAVIWDDYETGYTEDYIQKCIESFERFDLPGEIHQESRERLRLLHDLQDGLQRLFDPD
jgi:hypothetical protein